MPDNDVGCVLTPLKWARWAIEKFDLTRRWLDGAVILEPTAGQGAFLEALIATALESGWKPDDKQLACLYGVELKPESRHHFLQKIKKKYKVNFPERNIVSGDYLFDFNIPAADIAVGNPPWVNFTDLENDYKERLKPLFHKYALVEKGNSTLLGGSRVDLAALVIAKVLSDGLKPGGDAYFYMPLSILLNDGAHDVFRNYNINGIPFAITEIFEQTAANVFPGIGTSYCFCVFKRDREPSFPVPYHEYLNSTDCIEKSAYPAYGPNSPLLITELGAEPEPAPSIAVAKGSCPRQGVNTCGANDIFIFDRCDVIGNGMVKLSSKSRKNVTLPRALVYPLIGKGFFSQNEPGPERFIFIPHDRTNGKPLTEEQLQEYPEAVKYLSKVRKLLVKRRGTMINAKIKKGQWWALLGVGSYSFAPWKIVWQSYGVSRFAPRLIDTSENCWQGNNALHAFMSFTDEQEAGRVYRELLEAPIDQYLKLHRAGGSCNWAQPGRIKKFLEIQDS